MTKGSDVAAPTEFTFEEAAPPQEFDYEDALEQGGKPPSLISAPSDEVARRAKSYDIASFTKAAQAPPDLSFDASGVQRVNAPFIPLPKPSGKMIQEAPDIQLVPGMPTAAQTLGIARSLISGAEAIESPAGVILAPAAAESALVRLGLGLMGAKGAGEAAGRIAGTPNMTPGEKAEALTDIAQQGAMTLPALSLTRVRPPASIERILNATEKRKQPESDLGKHPGDETQRTPAETSRRGGDEPSPPQQAQTPPVPQEGQARVLLTPAQIAEQVGGWKFDKRVEPYKSGEKEVPGYLQFTGTERGKQATISIPLDTPPEEIAQRLMAKQKEFTPTADEVLKRPQPEASHSEIMGMSDKEVIKLANSKNTVVDPATGKSKEVPAWPYQYKGAAWGLSQAPELLPDVERLYKEANEKAMAETRKEVEDAKAGRTRKKADIDALLASQVRASWLNGAVEGLKRSDHDYVKGARDLGLAPTEPEKPPAETKPTTTATQPTPGEAKPPVPETPPQDATVGMGGARRGEVGTGAGGDVHGIAQRLREQRAKAGQVAPVEPGEGISAEDSVEFGRQLLASGADPKQVIEEFNRTKAVSSEGMALARAEGERLARVARQAEESFGTDSDEYRKAWNDLSAWDKQVKPMQTEWHKIGQAQQGEVDLDTGDFTALRRAHQDATGKDFTPQQAKAAKTLADQSKKAQTASFQAKHKVLDTVTKGISASDAERRAFDAAWKVVRENSVRLADLESKERVARKVLADTTAQVQKDAAAKAKRAREKVAMSEAIAKAESENLERLKKAKADVDLAQVQRKAAQRAMEAVAKQSREQAIRLAKAETAARFAKASGAKRVWDHVKEHYLTDGETDFDNVVHGTARDLGMSANDVRKALAEPAGAKRVTDEMYRKMAEQRRIAQQAKIWLRNQQTPGWERFTKAIPRVFFIDKIFGHGTVGMITHAGLNIFRPSAWATYWPNFFRQFGLVFKPAYHERLMQDLVRDPNFTRARRAGLANDPFRYADDYQNAAMRAFTNRFPALTGSRGFDALKLFRQARFNQAWNKLPQKLKNPDMAALLADSINHSTGVVSTPFREWSNATFFAPKLEASRWAWMVGDPLKASAIIKDWRNATPEQRAFAISQVKEKAVIAGMYFGLLAVNQGLLSAEGSEQKVNFTNPRRGDFLSFKVAGHNVGIVGPMIGMVRLFANLAHDAFGQRGKVERLTPRGQELGETAGQYARGKLSPIAGFLYNLFAQSDYQGRPLPFSSDRTPAYLRRQGIDRYTWGEYAATEFAPIPVEEAIRETLRDQGMGDDQIDSYVKALIVGVTTGATGARVTPETPRR